MALACCGIDIVSRDGDEERGGDDGEEGVAVGYGRKGGMLLAGWMRGLGGDCVYRMNGGMLTRIL